MIAIFDMISEEHGHFGCIIQTQYIDKEIFIIGIHVDSLNNTHLKTFSLFKELSYDRSLTILGIISGMHEVNEGKTSQFVGTKSDNKKMVYLVL